MSTQLSKRKISVAMMAALVALGATVSGCNSNKPTPELLSEAQQYQAKGDQKAALIQLKNAVAQSPSDGEARLRLGSLALEMGDLPSADKELRKAASLGVPAARTQPLLAHAMLEQGQFKELLDQITPEAAKSSAPLLTRRGDAYLALGDAAHAKESYQQALAVDAHSGDALVGLAKHALTQRDREAAQLYAAEAVAKDPSNADAWLFQGSVLRAANKPDEALAAFDKVLALKPNHRSAHVEKATLDISRGKYDAAQTELDQATKATPGNTLVTYTQGLLDYSQGKFKAAQESVQKVLKVAPNYVPAMLLAGAVELNLGATQQAEQHLRKVLDAAPDNLYARKLLAQTLLKSSQPADAAEALAPALAHPTGDAQLLALAGESYLQARQFDKASNYFEKAAEIAPKAAVVHTSLGLSRLNQGQQDKAISELKLATELDPKSLRAGFALVQAQVASHQYDKAMASVNELVQRQPDNAEVHNLKGGVCVTKGDMACARASFDKASALQPTYFAPVANLAELDVHDKNLDAARQRFNAFLQKNPKNFGAMAALADLALMQGKADEATTWLEKANNANPDAVAPALKLGKQYLRAQQPQKALVLARKYQTANPVNAELLELLGESQMANKDAPAALETYSKLVSVAPKSARAQMLLANVHAVLKRNDEAAADLRRAVELAPDMPEARVAQAQLAMHNGKPEDALAAARAAQKQPRLAMLGYVMEGDIQIAQQKAAPALAAYEKAYAVTPTPQLLVKVASTMKLAGRSADATKVVATWRKAHPDEPVVALYAAEDMLGNKELKPAIALLESVLKSQPDNAIALNNLAWAYQQTKDPRALPTAEQAFKVTGDSPAVMDTLGWMLVEQGNTGRGLPLLQKAVTLSPKDGDIRYHLAAGLSKAGDKVAARKELDKLLAENVQFTQLDAARSLRSTL
jgi:putative PEP-CTERM system TPR-repeat lipoprotein